MYVFNYLWKLRSNLCFQSILDGHGQGLEQVNNDAEKMENHVPIDNGGAGTKKGKKERKERTIREISELYSKELDNFHWEVNSVCQSNTKATSLQQSVKEEL